jgi:hypothetical protein
VILASTVCTALAAFSNPPADGAVYRAVRSWTWLDAVGWTDGATTAPVLVALSLLVLVGVRCRMLPLVAAGALVAGLGIGWLVIALVGRDRPVESAVQAPDSYPSTGVLLLTVLAGIVPMALESLTFKAAVRHVSAAVLGALVLVTSLVEVHSGARWPLDVLAAVLIGSALVTVSRVLLEEPRHPWCSACLWRRRAATAGQVSPVVVTVAPRQARQLHRVTLLWAGGLVVVYAVVGLTVGMPRTAESGLRSSDFDVPLQWAMLALIVAGVLVARRLHLTGAVMVAVAAVVLGYASSVEYPPWIAVLILAAAWFPALLLWLEWHRRTTLRAALVGAVVTSIVLGGFVSAAAGTYSYYWGPTHPPSLIAALDTDPVTWMWVGGVTATSAEVRLRTADPADAVRVVASEQPDLAAPVIEAVGRPDGDRVAAMTLDGLRPGAQYYYAAEVDGRLERGRVQSFRTFPDGAASFTVALGSCQLGGSNGRVFDAMRATDPELVVSLGDWTYSNIDEEDPDLFREQYDLNLTSPAQAALYGQTAFAYVWGDHDYGGNNADRTSPSRPAAMEVYRQMMPHYELAGPESPVYQAFTVGRVRFLLTDTRSARDPADDPSGPYRSTLGAEQREWLLGELSQADSYGLVVWVNPDPWVAEATPGADTWGGFAEERQVIADAIAAHAVDNLLMVGGDAHMLAFDDGTNTDYSTSQSGGFPLFQTAAVDRPGSVKGGPYSGQVIPGGGQFGTLDVRDDGTSVAVTLTGWNWRTERLFTEEVRFPSGSG